jgi:uncharacterized membrane protein
MRAGDRAIYFRGLATVACAVGIIAIPSPALTLPLALLLACYLPGSAIMGTAFRSPQSTLTALIFSAGLSITTTILCGFALHLLDAMTRVGWATALCLVTLAALGGARLRRSRWFESDSHPSPPLRPMQAAMMLVGAGLALAAVVIERQQTFARSEFAYTEFWMVPEPDRGAVLLGVKNEETAATTYDVEVSIDDTIAHVWRGVPLAAGETWQAEFTMPTRAASSKGVQAKLFKNSDRGVIYRRVWLPSPAAG